MPKLRKIDKDGVTCKIYTNSFSGVASLNPLFFGVYCQEILSTLTSKQILLIDRMQDWTKFKLKNSSYDISCVFCGFISFWVLIASSNVLSNKCARWLLACIM